MSSHREAPEISMDPVADSTDVYAFVSPDRPRTVTLIANYIPLQGPAGGPNFYEFGDDVRYAIHIDTQGNSEANVTYEFDFTTTLADPNTFLCNTGPLSTPRYEAALAKPAIHTLSDGSRVFAGQRAEGFYVDLGSIFDLGNLRPFQNL